MEAGGEIVGYSWGRVTCLIEMYHVRGNISPGR